MSVGENRVSPEAAACHQEKKTPENRLIRKKQRIRPESATSPDSATPSLLDFLYGIKDSDDYAEEGEQTLPDESSVASHAKLNLKYIPFTRNHLVQHRIDEESDKETGNQPCHNHDGEGFLSVRADAGSERGGE
jgi:hypothetical protein